MKGPTIMTLALMMTVVPAWAGPLAPTKPSELVTIVSDGGFTRAPCFDPEAAVGGVLNRDGSTNPLVVPDGQVLVLLGGSWKSIGRVATGRLFHLLLRLARPEGGEVHLISTGGGAVSEAAAAGEVSGSFRLEPGLVLAPGTTLCARIQSLDIIDGVDVSVQGFFTKDK